MSKTPNKARVSQSTLGLIGERAAARRRHDLAAEKLLHRAVRRAARADRGRWLDGLVADGTWKGVRSLSRPKLRRQGRLGNLEGELVGSEDRAETMATYLERVQWKVQAAVLIEDPVLGPPLQVELQGFTGGEIRKVIQKMANNKVSSS